MKLVVDCSFIMSSILPDELESKVQGVYSGVINNIYEIYVPVIFWLECNNVLISSFRRGRINENDYNEYLSILELIPINIDKFSSTTESLYIISKIAKKYNLTTYDASYLELALRNDAKLATLDKNLTAAARAANLELAI